MVDNQRYYIFILPLLLFIAIATYFIIATSFSVRYWADDFCAAVVHNKYGLWGAQKFWWMTWSGRFSYNFMLHVFTAFGEWIIRILPLLIYSALILSIVPVFINILTRQRHKIQKSVMLASFFIIIILINAPNIVQSFYWQTGALVYSMPLIFFNLFLTLTYLLYKKSNKKTMAYSHVLVPFLLTFIGGGFVETFAIAQSVIIALMIICSFIIKFPNREKIRKILFFGLAGSVASLVAMSLSPGIRARQMTFSERGSVIFTLRSTLLGAKWYLQRFLSIKTSIYSFVVLFSITYFLVSEYFRNTKKKIGIKTRDLLTISIFSIFSAILTTTAVFGISYYAMAYLPPERALFIVVYFIFVAFVVFSVCVSFGINIMWRKIQKQLNNINIVLFIFFMVLLFSSFCSHWSVLKYRMEDYAFKWDIQEKEIRKQIREGEDVVIGYVKPVGDIDGFIENEGWVSSCASGYYQVDEIRVVE